MKIPKERESGEARGFAFVEFKHDVSVPYALHLLNGTSLYGRQLNLKYRKGSKHEQNPNQGPPPQVFPKGFPNPLTVSEPPNVQRTLLPLPMPTYQFDPSLYQGQAMEMQKDRFRGSPVPDGYCSPVSQASPQSFSGSYGQQSYEDVRPSSRGQFRGTPPGSRDQSPRWAGNGRGERPRSEDRRQGHRNTEFARNESYPHHSRQERHHHHHHHHSREDERHHQRSRTVDDHQRGLNGGHHFRDRSVEDFNRRSTGFRSNDGYRHQYHR